jgi:hypothetical protein
MHFHTKFLAAAPLILTLCAAPAHAACLTPPASADELEAFKNDPGGLLKRFPLGSGSMASAIRVLAASDGGVLGALASLVKDASDAQKSAIAAGMAQAALACRTQDPALALQIQEAIAGVDNAAVLAQFAAITGDTQTAATGGGGAGGGAGAGGAGGGGAGGGASGEGGQTGGSNSGSSGATGGSTGTNGPSAFSVSASSASQTGATTQTINAATSVVSPSQ